MVKIFKKSMLKTIDKAYLENTINQYDLSGVSDDNNIIVSLTSFPQRIYEIYYTVFSLLTQTIKPSKVILWLAKEEFPNLEKDLPENLLKLKQNGLTIEWCNNIYSYKKLIPAMKKYPDCIIVTADDDIFYENNWLEKLLATYNEQKNCIICHRAHRIKLTKNGIAPYKKWNKKVNNDEMSFLNFFTGVGGVLYPPKCLNIDVLNEELFTKLAPKADDIWFWAMAVLNNTKILIAKDKIKKLTYINPERERGLTDEITLFSTNKNGGNDEQLANILSYYPQILNLIK